MTKIKNTGEAKEPVHTKTGVVFLHPGQTRDLQLSDPGAKFVAASETLKVEEAEEPKTRKKTDKETV